MKKIKLVLLAIISSSAMVSCVDDDVKTYAEGSRIVGFKNTDASHLFTPADTEPIIEFEPIDLIGGANGTPSDEPVVIKYEVDPASTAIEGTEFSFLSASREVTILPGQDFAKVEYTIIPANLTEDPKSLILHLTEITSNNGVISEMQKTVTIIMAKCESDLAGTYDLTVTQLDNNDTFVFPGEIITAVPGEIAQYETSSSGPFGDGDLTPAPRDGFIFSDVCHSISILKQDLGGYYDGNPLEGEADSGSVTLDPVTGAVISITMHYTIQGLLGGTEKTQYTAVYTKI